MAKETTTIEIQIKTKERLVDKKEHVRETYDDVINRALDKADKEE